MFEDQFITLLAVVTISVLAAGVIVAGLLRFMPNANLVTPRAERPLEEDAAVFLFDGVHLSDANALAQDIFVNLRIDRADMGSLVAHLDRQFPDAGTRIDAVRKGREGAGAVSVAGRNRHQSLVISKAHGILRLAVSGFETGLVHAPGAHHARPDETILESLAEDAPQLVWQVDDAGQVTWANRAYLGLADRVLPKTEGDDPIWPVRPVIPDLRPAEPGAGPITQRVPLMLPDLTEPQWFEVTSVSKGTDTVHFAVDASRIIQAEAGRHKFIQTLTKTFAHLSIGLAIFDRDRRLVLFNPAFLDLTGLPVGFLSGRPQVNSVLDRLRDINMLPEPKNYASWRDQMAALEAAAVRGTYCETWSLPSGQTYRVTGKPHPDGAIAFLFEDISTEILLTRSFRSELEAAQSVIDSLDEGIAVFSQAGTLTMCNAVYAETWGHGVIGLADISVHDELELWTSRAGPSAVWDRLQESFDLSSDRQRWQDRVKLTDGRMLICRFAPLTGGAMLVGFRTPAEEGMLPALPVPSPLAFPAEVRATPRPLKVAGI
jgi:PAS domain-containing protein